MASERPVGVFDSGAGGISVLAALLRELPHEDFLYFGDTANAPYGTKTAEAVLKAAAALHIAKEVSIKEGIEMAKEALDSGKAKEQLARFAAATQSS